VKNVNSVRFAMQAVEAEALRQIEVWEGDGEVQQETRLFDSNRGVTRAMRSKEDAHDYRYFPDPDLLPLVLDQAWIDDLRALLPELPDAKKARFMTDYGLSAYDAGVLVAEQTTALFYETVAEGRDPKLAANWVTGDFFAALNRTGRTIDDPPVTAEQLGKLLDMIADNTINGKIAKDVFETMVARAHDAVTPSDSFTAVLTDPAQIVDELGLRQVTDSTAIDAAVDKIIAANQDKVAEFRSGKDKLFGFFVGQVMKAMQGKANPALVNETLKKRLT
jgi:aspartyl-tRNA(Asn)/glutamyl-tRNA(Gln) amidotransferase subunit B